MVMVWAQKGKNGRGRIDVDGGGGRKHTLEIIVYADCIHCVRHSVLHLHIVEADTVQICGKF